MELKLLERIEKLGYNGQLIEPNKFKEALKQGPKSPEFTKLVAWLADEIALLNDMDETIHAIVSPDDSSSFLLELSCFLKELGCMNERLMTGNVNTRLTTEQDRYILLDFLGAELKTCRLLEFKKHKNLNSTAVVVEESDTAKDLKDMLIALNFEKPPNDITSEKLFTRLENKLTEVLKIAPSELVGQPLITHEFSEADWKDLQHIQQELHDEYRVRRDMLLKRLDVTVQSFLWSDRVKAQEAELNRRYEETRKFLNAEPDITIADLLAARDDIALMEKTSNASVRKNTQSEINKVIIGEVPDRGGRPYEQEPPPPEMPPWQKDRVPGPSTSGNRGSGGNRGGGRGRGNFQNSNATYINDRNSYSGYGDSGHQSSNFAPNSGGYGGQGGKQGGGYGGGYGGQGGGYGGGYGAGQGGGYGGGQGGYGGGFGTSGNNSYSGDNRDGGYGHRYCNPGNIGPTSQSEYKSGQQYQRGGSSGRGRGGRVQGGWNQGIDNYQRGGYNRGGQGGRQY